MCVSLLFSGAGAPVVYGYAFALSGRTPRRDAHYPGCRSACPGLGAFGLSARLPALYGQMSDRIATTGANLRCPLWGFQTVLRQSPLRTWLATLRPCTCARAFGMAFRQFAGICLSRCQPVSVYPLPCMPISGGGRAESPACSYPRATLWVNNKRVSAP